MTVVFIPGENRDSVFPGWLLTLVSNDMGLLRAALLSFSKAKKPIDSYFYLLSLNQGTVSISEKHGVCF